MKGKRILIADRDRRFLSSLTAHFVAEEYQAAVAVDAVQAMESIRRQAPDLVIVSTDLPGGGAAHVRERLRRIGQVALPIVFLTEGNSREAIDEAQAEGAAAAVDRSAPVETILSLVQSLLTDPIDRSRAVKRQETLHVLAVEDDEPQRRLIQACLDAPGRESIEVTFADGVASAAPLIQQCKYSCVLLDHQLPDGTGLDILEDLESELLTTPVIALVARDDPRVAVQYFRAGCVDFFVKQDVLNADALRRRIAEAMARFHRRALATIIERRQIGNAIGESQEGLIALARTDRLLGICNRGVFEEFYPTYHAEMTQSRSPYAVCMIDVDQFKRYNDKYGHAAGDDALRRVARVVGSTLRDQDFIARYGGEELVVLLDRVDETTVEAVAERLRQLVFEEAIEHEGNRPFGRVTVSIGVALYEPDSELSTRELIERADAALYRAKAAGRNCVEVAEPMAPQRRSA
ncbi:MAG: diguanylate cyclase [Planctomycetota bacterium]|jgi:diguanylate cyclase (GGDEF)-like protein